MLKILKHGLILSWIVLLFVATHAQIVDGLSLTILGCGGWFMTDCLKNLRV